MTKLAFITDLHFGRQTAGAAQALLDDLRQQKPDLILIGGDVTQRGLGYQYRECQKFLAELPAPWLSVIGNHDVPAWNLLERFTMPYRAYQKFVTRELNPTFVNDTIAVQGINSARRFMRDWAWEQGEISGWQIEMAQEFFAAHSDKFKILMVHHPLTHPPDQPTKILVRNRDNALRGFVAAGVDMICTGHLHRTSVRDVASLIPDHTKPLWALMGGTALCDRLRGERNSYWEIMLAGAEPQFTRRELVDGRFL